MMKTLGINAALYGLPAVVTLAAFSVGHMSIKPEQDRLAPPEALVEEQRDAPPEEDAAEEVPDDVDPMLLVPGYQYYPYPAAIVGNVPGSNSLFSFEIAVSIYETPLNSNGLIDILEEREPQLRPLILAEAVGLNDEVLLSYEGRIQLAETIKETINMYLVKWGYDPFIHAVEFTSFIIT